jgi:hypothetical protein
MGAFAYRAIALGFAYSGPGETPIIVLWSACFVAAVMLARSARDGLRPSRLVLVGVALAGIVLGGALAFALVRASGQIDLHDHELPGLTIALPGALDTKPVGSYAAGKLKLDSVAKSDVFISVAWEPGAMLSEEDVAALVRLEASEPDAKMRPVADGDLAVGGSLKHSTYELSTKGRTTLQTVFPCGSRRFTVLTLAPGRPTLHARILASARCHPDAAREAETGEVPVVIHLPSGWETQPTEPGQLTFASEAKNSAVIVRPLVSTITPAALQKIMPGLFAAMGSTGTLGSHRSERGRDVWPGTLDVNGEKGGLFVVSTPCPDRAMTLLILYLHPVAADEKVPDFVLDAHCPSGDEPIPKY